MLNNKIQTQVSSYYSSTTKNQAKKISVAQTSVLEEATQTKEEHCVDTEAEQKEKEVTKKQNAQISEKEEANEISEAEHIQELINKFKEEKRSIQKALMRSKNNKSYSAVLDLAQLASARTVSQVRTIRGKISRRYMQLMKSGDTSESTRVMLGAIKKVLKKADTKIKRLKEEEILLGKQKSAQRIRQEDMAKELESELNTKRRNRKAHEHADIMEAIKNPHYGAEEAPIVIQSSPSSQPISTVPPIDNSISASTAVSASTGISTGVSLDMML